MFDDDIEEWLRKSDLPMRCIDHGRWSLSLSHQFVSYAVIITNSGGWLSYGADLASDIDGIRKDEFYRALLSLNGRLNGTHIAIEDDRIALIRDDYLDYVDENNFYRVLNHFHTVHEYVYGRILEIAEELEVYFYPP